MKIKITILIITVFSSAVVLAKGQTNLPDYQLVLDAQMKCDSKSFNSLPWKKERDYARLATKVWTLVDNVKLTSTKVTKDPVLGEMKNFVLTYQVFGIFRCGESVTAFNGKNGTIFKAQPSFMQGWKSPGTFELSTQIDPDKKNEPVDQERPTIELTVSDYIFDEPAKSGREGFSCFAKLTDFIQAPTKAIDLNKLCQGEPKSKRLAAEKEIQRVWSLLK